MFASAVLAVLVASACSVRGEGTTEMFDAMQQLMTGDPTYFDPQYLDSLMQCWDQIHPDLRAAQDIAWAGMVAFSDNDGFADDKWGGTVSIPHYFETNRTAQDYHNIMIYEPCNYVSNVAYYHVATEICLHSGKFSIPAEYETGLGQAFSYLGYGSSFWHGSHTVLGAIADNRFISIIAYLAHQASVSSLGGSSVITDLSFTARPQSSVEIAANISDMLMTQDVTQWEQNIINQDLPDYFLTFAGIMSTTFTLALDDATVDALIPILMDLFGLDPDLRVFIQEYYIPEIRSLTNNVNIGPIEKTRLQLNMVSAVGKLFYAFVWQEQIFDIPFIQDPEANANGADMIATVNNFLNGINSFEYYEQNFQDGVNIYPGDFRCNRQTDTPHSKWHLQSAVGLMDLVYLADYVHGLTVSSK